MSSEKVVRWLTTTLLIGVLAPACGEHSTAPSPPPPPTVRPNVTIARVTSTAESGSGGYRYRTVVQLRESAGVNATIVSIDIAFARGSATLAASHHDQPLADGATVCPASGTVSTREFVTTDADPAHPYASTVSAIVTFADGSGFTATAAGSADVPPPSSQTPTYSITGVITDAGTRAGIAGARIEALNGANAGKAATTDSGGTYVIDHLVAETFRMRASAADYSAGEQNVTIPDNPRADFALQRVTAGCAYTVSPTGTVSVTYGAGQSTLTIARTAGTCVWTATTDAAWITLDQGGAAGTGTLTFHYSPNNQYIDRIATITVQWDGGSSVVTIRQFAQPVDMCVATITVGGQSTIAVPAAGGTYTASVTPVQGMPPGVCGAWTATASPAITILGPGFGPALPASISFTVAANPAASRTLTIVVSINSTVGPQSSFTLTANQAAP